MKPTLSGSRRQWWIVMLAVASQANVLVAPVVAAEPSTPGEDEARDAATRTARDHFMRGRKLFDAGDYKAAIREFDAAHRIKPHPANYYNLAQCYEKLGDIPAAVDRYEGYLRELPTAPDRAIVEAKLTTLRSVLRATPTIGFVRVDVSEAGAVVQVRGTTVGVTPLESVLELDAGEYDVELRKDGFVPWTGKVRVEPGVSTVLAATLVKVDAKGTRAGRGGAIAFTAMAGGFLLVGTSLGTGALISNGGFRAEGVRNEVAPRLALAADIAYGAAALTGVTAVTLWIASAVRRGKAKRASRGASSARVLPWLATGSVGASLWASF